MEDPKITELKNTPCRYCAHCAVGKVTKLGIEVGYCLQFDQFIEPEELDEPQWDMCGEMLLDA